MKHLTPAAIAIAYDDEHLALALTTTLTVIGTLDEQVRLLEKTVLKKARLRPEWEVLETVLGHRQDPWADDHV